MLYNCNILDHITANITDIESATPQAEGLPFFVLVCSKIKSIYLITLLVNLSIPKFNVTYRGAKVHVVRYGHRNFKLEMIIGSLT